MDPLTLALAGGGALASLFGSQSPPSVDQVMADANKYFGPGQQYGPQTKLYPSGFSGTPSGGGISSSQSRNLNLSGNNKIQDLISGGKYKNLSSDQRSALTSGQDVDWSKLPKWMRQDLQKRGVQRPNAQPQSTFNADPWSEQYFDYLKGKDFQNAQRQDDFNQQYMYPMMSSLAGLNQNAIGSANEYIDRGFTEVDPGVMTSINKAADDSYNQAVGDYTSDYQRGVGGAAELLGVSGTPVSWDSGSGQKMNSQYDKPFAQGLASLANNKENQRRSMISQSLADNRAGYGALGSTPGFNSAISGMSLPGIQYNSAFTNPTGQFDPGMVTQQGQYANSFGQNNSQFNQSLGASLFNGAQAQASRPGPLAGVGSVLGTVAGYSAFGGQRGNTGGTGGFFGNMMSPINKQMGTYGSQAGNFVKNHFLGGRPGPV